MIYIKNSLTGARTTNTYTTNYLENIVLTKYPNKLIYNNNIEFNLIKNIPITNRYSYGYHTYHNNDYYSSYYNYNNVPYYNENLLKNLKYNTLPNYDQFLPRQHRISDVLVIEKRMIRIKDDQEIERDIILNNNTTTRKIEIPITNIYPPAKNTSSSDPFSL